MANSTPNAVHENLDDVIRHEEELSQRSSTGERVGELIGGFIGSLPFVAIQIFVVVTWTVINSDMVPGIRAFDPYPFALGGAALSLECVFMAAFVLLMQKHESRLSERRSHLSLQMTLLIEREVTKLMQMTHRASVAAGHDDMVMDDEAHELGRNTEVDHLVEALDRRLS